MTDTTTLTPEQRQRGQVLAFLWGVLGGQVAVEDVLYVADWVVNGGTPLRPVAEVPQVTWHGSATGRFKSTAADFDKLSVVPLFDTGVFDRILNHLAGPQHLGGCVVTEEAPGWMAHLSESDYQRVPTDRIVWMAKQYDATIYRDPKTNHLYLRTPCEEHESHVYTTRPRLADA